MGIENALEEVRSKIISSAANAGRNPETIKLIAVSKTVSLQKILEAVKAGAVIFGENRVQEAKGKIEELKLQVPDPGIEWHLIGNLQKNKAKTAVRLFDLIQSVDSVGLARELDKYAAKENKVQRVLIQVKLSGEEAKHGISEDGFMDLSEKISDMKNLRLEGLMTIPPFFTDAEKARPYFSRLRRLAEEAVERGYPVHELSMGMSNDFGVAIQEGATMVRVGTAIFGERSC